MLSGALLGLLSFAAARISARDAAPAEVSRLPVWPGPAAAERNYPMQYVFRDQTGEIVIFYPDPSQPDQRVTFRFWLQTRVEPAIMAGIVRGAGGEFTYSYSIKNGVGAKTSIWAWAVIAPPTPDLAISHPLWHGTNSWHSVGSLQAAIGNTEPSVFVQWLDPSAPVAPGSELGGFKIVCSLKPGLTTAYVSGNEAPIRAPTELAEAVVEQLLPLEKPNVMRKVDLTVGPRFSAEATREQIRSAYLDDVQGAIRQGFLDGSSPFIREVQRVLSSPAPVNSDPLAGIKEQPRSRIEQELAAAIRLALAP